MFKSAVISVLLLSGACAQTTVQPTTQDTPSSHPDDNASWVESYPYQQRLYAAASRFTFNIPTSAFTGQGPVEVTEVEDLLVTLPDGGIAAKDRHAHVERNDQGYFLVSNEYALHLMAGSGEHTAFFCNTPDPIQDPVTDERCLRLSLDGHEYRVSLVDDPLFHRRH